MVVENGQNADGNNDGLSYLTGQIEWCVGQYDEFDPGSDSGQNNQSFLPDWSAFRTLQNNLHEILVSDEQARPVALASLLITIFDKVFSDLCSDTPWDKEQLINDARKRLHQILLKLLTEIEIALKQNTPGSDGELWRAYSAFEFEYNKILCHLNKEDQIAIDAMISSQA